MISLNFWKKLIFVPFILLACADDSAIDTSNKIKDAEKMEPLNLPEKLGLGVDEVKMFTVPTPLQIASALRVMNVDYNENLLLENDKINLSSDIYLSLSLGMYLTDLGYSVIYNNRQKSLNFAKDVQYIMENLPIPTYINDGFKSRFMNNIEDKDSLSKIILEGYYEANQQITQTHNEGMGLLILTGSYIEGLHLASSFNSTHWVKEYDSMLIQQKLFLQNFITLLDGYNSNSKIAMILDQLNELQLIFEGIEIQFNDQTKSHELVQPFSLDDKEKINEIVSALRIDIIERSH